MHNVEADTDVLLFYGVYDIKQLLISDNNLIPCIFENKHPWKHEIQIYKCLHNLILPQLLQYAHCPIPFLILVLLNISVCNDIASCHLSYFIEYDNSFCNI